MKTLDMILSATASGGVIMHAKTAGLEASGGGCRAGFAGLVRAMGRLGKYKIRAFSTYAEKHIEHDCIDYIRLDQYRIHANEVPDAILAYYDVLPLAGNLSPLRIGSHHTLLPYIAWDHIDINTAPCSWARDFLKRGYHPHGRWETLPNAVEGLDGIEWDPVPGRVIYHTSPDRGLHLLLDMWPEIRARVPHATLHVVGDVRQMIDCKYPPRSVREQRAKMMAAGLAKATAAGGLTMLGRLTRADLLEELRHAACFAFPCDVVAPCETFSISVLESMSIGVPVVLQPQDALESLWGDAVVIAGVYQNEFVEAVVEVITDADAASIVSRRQKKAAEQYTFENAAKVLDEIIEGESVEKEKAA
jgi:glycosyltransferase involved in cell wall biosynthesis